MFTLKAMCVRDQGKLKVLINNIREACDVLEVATIYHPMQVCLSILNDDRDLGGDWAPSLTVVQVRVGEDWAPSLTVLQVRVGEDWAPSLTVVRGGIYDHDRHNIS